MDAWPHELSGGERQRVAVARSLINEPTLLLADEPTGNLDERNARMVEDMLFALARAHGRTMILVTHDPALAARAEGALPALQRECCHRHDEVRCSSLSLRVLRGRGGTARYLRGAVIGIAISLVPLIVVMEVSTGMIDGITARLLEVGTYHLQIALPPDTDDRETGGKRGVDLRPCPGWWRPFPSGREPRCSSPPTAPPG